MKQPEFTRSKEYKTIGDRADAITRRAIQHHNQYKDIFVYKEAKRLKNSTELKNKNYQRIALENVEIRITADCFQGFLKVQVENDFDEKHRKITKGSGIGLQNIVQRLKLIFGRDDLMLVSADNGKFLVTITFPQNGLHDKDNYN